MRWEVTGESWGALRKNAGIVTEVPQMCVGLLMPHTNLNSSKEARVQTAKNAIGLVLLPPLLKTRRWFSSPFGRQQWNLFLVTLSLR